MSDLLLAVVVGLIVYHAGWVAAHKWMRLPNGRIEMKPQEDKA